MAKAQPKYTAGFRRLLTKLVVAKAEERPAIEAQIKEICELASPGSGERFISLFWNQWRSSGHAIEYLPERDRILARLTEFVAVKQKPHMEYARQKKIDRKSPGNARRNRQMVDDYLRMKPSWDDSDTKLKADIGKRRGVKRSRAIEIINRGLEDRGRSAERQEP